MLKKVTLGMGLDFIDHLENFPLHHWWLWSSRDSIHLSSDHGLPMLLKGIHCKVNDISARGAPGQHYLRGIATLMQYQEVRCKYNMQVVIAREMCRLNSFQRIILICSFSNLILKLPVQPVLFPKLRKGIQRCILFKKCAVSC